jgi:hypothetical protein
MKLSKIFTSRTSALGRSLVFSLLALVALASIASATPLAGTVLANPGDTVFPGFVAPGTPAGTLLASLVAPYSFSTTAGTTSGSLVSAVYMNSSGTLDFYYQVNNAATSATAIARETDDSFAGFMTFLGFRVDGSTLAGTLFVDGTVPPVTGDRSSGTGTTVGFSFNPPDPAKILPGLSSNVLVISTDATMFRAGNASVIDGGTQTVASFQPGVPEPASFALLGLGLLAIGGIGRKLKARN